MGDCRKYSAKRNVREQLSGIPALAKTGFMLMDVPGLQQKGMTGLLSELLRSHTVHFLSKIKESAGVGSSTSTVRRVVLNQGFQPENLLGRPLLSHSPTKLLGWSLLGTIRHRIVNEPEFCSLVRKKWNLGVPTFMNITGQIK